MPAEAVRTVLASIPDADDRELHISRVIWPGHSDFGEQLEIAEFIPSRQVYGRGFLFDPRHLTKVLTGFRAAKAAS